LDNGKAIGAGHLNVQENEIRRMFFDFGDGRVAAVGFGYDLGVRLAAQKTEDFAARGSFVIDDEDAKRSCGGHAGAMVRVAGG
jgi:hypothetical protein